MLPDIERTIVALASGAQGAARAIVRLSGPDTRQVLKEVCGWNAGKSAISEQANWLVRSQRQVVRGECFLPAIGRLLPVTILFWPDSRSYTGQSAAELHLIGSLPLAEAVIARCIECGAQPAERGEFTLRAFLAGKLDLAQAEAVLGVIEADSRETLISALGQLGGNLAPAIRPLRDQIVHVVAELEAGLDFVDEDIQFITTDQLVAQLLSVQAALERFAQRLSTRSSTQHLPRVVLVGLPNSGKSSLFNRLCEASLAIVTDVAGTTRDYLEQHISLGRDECDGHSVSGCGALIIDTAGWELLSGDDPRAMAQQQLLECLRRADLCLLCIDASVECDVSKIEHTLGRWIGQAELQPGCEWLLVATKCDALNVAAQNEWRGVMSAVRAGCGESPGSQTLGMEPIMTSSRSGSGMEQLRRSMAERLANRVGLGDDVGEASDSLTVVHQTAVRCRSALSAAATGIRAALEYARDGSGEELVAAELRLVLDDLGSIIGEVHSDDILGEIFSRFCIGK